MTLASVLLAVAGFVGMEAVSYATHRWVMHGFGYAWHRSHHQPPRGRVEANDRFPLLFASLGVALFAVGSGPWPPAWPLAVGVTAYGVVYLVVHEVVIHRRLRIPIPPNRYLTWLTEAHGDHHRGGDEPFGMLLPLVRRPRQEPARDALDRGSRARRDRRSATAARRARL